MMVRSGNSIGIGLLLLALLAPGLVNAAPSTGTAAVLAQARADQKAGRFAAALARLDRRLQPGIPREDQLALFLALSDVHFDWAQTLARVPSYAAATRQYEATLEIDRALRPRNAVVDLNDIGTLYERQGQYERALGLFQQSLALGQKAGDADADAGALGNIGTAYTHLGRYDQAVEALQQSLALTRKLGDRVGEAITLVNIGEVYRQQSRYAQALDFYQEALPIMRRMKDRASEAATLNNMGAAFDDLSQQDKALDAYQQALALLQQLGDVDGEAATLSNIGTVYGEMGQYSHAVTFLQQALQIRRRAGDTSAGATTLGNIGVVYDRLGQPARALPVLQQALALERKTGDRQAEALTLNTLGTTLSHLGRQAEATDTLQQSLTLSRQMGDRAGEADTLGRLMGVWDSQQNPRLAVWYGKQAVNVLQTIRQGLQSLDKATQQSFLRGNQDAYRDLVDLLIRQGRLPEAEQVLAMLKQQEVRAFVTRDAALSPAALAVSFDPDEQAVAARYQSLADPVTQLGARLESLRAKKNRTDADAQQIVALQDQLGPAARTFESFLSSDLPHELAQAVPNADRPDIAAAHGPLQKQLAQMGPGTVALFTLVEPDRYRVIVVTSQTAKAEEYPIKAEDLRKKVLAWRQALQDPRLDPRPLGKELCDILLGPIERDLIGANAQMLMWSLDDVLRYVPLAALYDGKHYLVEKYCTSVFTGASVPALPQQPSDWQGSSGVLLALGVTQAHTVMDPATGKSVDFPALPGVAEELKEIVRSAGNPTGALAGKPLEDGQFTQNALRLGLTVGYPVVHIASHFALGADYKSSFLLLGDGTALTLDALLGQGGQVFAGVDLLTLSACQTGEGGGDGHEFESLGALAQAQGASSVLASLWPVSDVTTPLLMRAFYTQRAGGAGITKAESLRQAQLKLLGGTISPPPSDALARAGRAAEGDDASALPVFTPDPKAPYAHPYYWAPFVLIGNWR